MGRKKNNYSTIASREFFVAELEIKYNLAKRTGMFIINSSSIYQILLNLWDKGLVNLQEQFIALFFSSSNEVIGYKFFHSGGINSTIIDTRLILSAALKCLAVSIIVAHNHPSGNTMPSNNDIEAHNRLKRSCKDLQINLLDNLIVTDKSYYSFNDNGMV